MPIPPDPPELVTELLDHLVTAGLVRRSSDAATPSAPPRLLADPRDGVPKPGTNDDGIIAGAFLTSGVPPRRFESFLRTDIVEIRIRALEVTKTWELYRVLRGELIDRRAWMMGAREVIESMEWRSLQRIGSNEDGFVHLHSVLFTTRA